MFPSYEQIKCLTLYLIFQLQPDLENSNIDFEFKFLRMRTTKVLQREKGNGWIEETETHRLERRENECHKDHCEEMDDDGGSGETTARMI